MLEWNYNKSECKTYFGKYSIEPDPFNEYSVKLDGKLVYSYAGASNNLIGSYKNEESAIAAVESDFEKRRYQCLTNLVYSVENLPTVAWQHPKAKWVHTLHETVANHCAKGAETPIPLIDRRHAEVAITWRDMALVEQGKTIDQLRKDFRLMHSRALAAEEELKFLQETETK